MVVAEKADLLETVGRIARLLSAARHDEQALRILTRNIGGVNADYGRLIVAMEASFHHLTELMVSEGLEIHHENREYRDLQQAFAGYETRLQEINRTLNQLFGDLGKLVDYDW